MSFFKTEHRKALSMLLAVLLILSMMAITTLMPNSLFTTEVAAATSGEVSREVSDDSSGIVGGTAPTPTPTPAAAVVKTTVTVSATLNGTTATASVSAAAMDETVAKAIADAAKAGGVPEVVVQVNVPANADSLKVDLPASSLKTLADVSGSRLTISSSIGSITLDHTALAALVGNAQGSTITLDVAPVAESALNAGQIAAIQGATVMDVSLSSGGVAIHSFNRGTIAITLPYTLKSGETANSIIAYFLTNNGYLTRCATNYADGSVTFETNHLSKYVIGTSALAQAVSFVDVTSSAWYYDPVGWGVYGGITKGTGDGTTFSPTDGCTRAQFATFLYRAAGSPSVSGVANTFTDVSETAHADYYNAILWAVQQGITVGTGDGTTFSPDDTIIRAQAVTMMHRFAQKNGIATLTNGTAFSDAPNSGSTAAYYDAILWARANGITTGNSTTANTFGPMDTCNRAEMITFLYRLCNEA